jgi:hypothetical protein
MAVDHIRYDILAQEALRGVVRTVLADAARNGLPGEHHFYITFNTQTEGVRLSQRMLEQYPKEMTIVLQHQFWDLTVAETGFEVGLSFGGVAERLAVPFAAIESFFDPSVQFGLQFAEAGTAVAGAAEEEQAAPSSERVAKRPAAEQRARGPVALPPIPPPANPEPSQPAPTTSAEAKPDGGAEVVRLDRFRKK